MRLRLSPVLCCLSFALGLPASASGDGSETYAALRAASLERRSVAVRDLALAREAFRFTFESGTFTFLEAVGGAAPGAVFVGTGRVELAPESEAERRHLALVAKEKDLKTFSDRFQSAVLLFGPSTASEIRSHAEAGDVSPDPGAEEVLRKTQKRLRADFKVNVAIRQLRQLLNPGEAKREPFLLLFEGKRAAPALVAVDPLGIGWLSPERKLVSTSALWVAGERGGFWYLGSARGDAEAGAHAQSYTVDTTISKNAHLAGETTIHLASQGAIRVLPLQLEGKLRIREASFSEADGASEAAAFVQEDEKADSEPAVLFPREVGGSKPVSVRISYEGREVLESSGDGSFIVRARTSWYPNLGAFRELATFDLTYRIPKGLEVVSVGTQAADRTEGDTRVQRFTTGPVRVAGFNYGKFRRVEKVDEAAGRLKVTVYTNPATPDIVEEINRALAAHQNGALIPAGLEGAEVNYGTQAGLGKVAVDSESLAQSALADGLNTARVATKYFGPAGTDHVAITQQSQWMFGQSWPALVFLPYLASLDGTTRREMGFGKGAADFVENVGPHEMAHQWWGHLVGWSSYRDQWLSEGFAEFTAALVAQHTRGLGAYNAFWERSRKLILGKEHGAELPSWQVGAITDGWRLETERSPGAYAALVYAKGAYVLHMLRMLMRDPTAKEPDAAFIAAMTDFAKTWSGKDPSTADFQAVLEKHIVPNLNSTGDGKLDWFFRQWVDGTEIPVLTAKLDFKEQGGKYHVTGSVTQSDVSAGCRNLVPLYAEFPNGDISRLGLLPMLGATTVPIDFTLALSKKPKRIVVNAVHDILSRD